ncbi:MAG: hypothetical protein ABSH34_32895, partial [Verrucomicrobiota bacterium]
MNRRTPVFTLGLFLVLVGCGGGSVGNSNPPPPPPPTDPDQRADLLLSQMTLDEKLQLVHGNFTFQNPVTPRGAGLWVLGIPRLGIPDLLLADGPTGVGDSAGPAT